MFSPGYDITIYLLTSLFSDKVTVFNSIETSRKKSEKEKTYANRKDWLIV